MRAVLMGALTRPTCARWSSRTTTRGRANSQRGFNLHAGVRVAADDRDGLERLCRSMARPAVASGRVTRLSDGNVAYRVKAPRRAGATHRVMTPMEFMARLSELAPPPRTPLADAERAHRLGAVDAAGRGRSTCCCARAAAARMTMIAALTDRAAIVRILEHLSASTAG
jgi:hypothetical protein